jgi:hypothetical protein
LQCSKKAPTLIFDRSARRRSPPRPARIEPIVSSTSFIGGFSPRRQRLGLFSERVRTAAQRGRARVAAYDALPQTGLPETLRNGDLRPQDFVKTNA